MGPVVRAAVALATAGAVVLGACGDDSGGAGGDASSVATTSTTGRVAPTGDVEIGQVDPASVTGDYAEGTDAPVGSVMAMGPLTVTVEEIAAGSGPASSEDGTTGTVAVRLVADNPSGDLMTGPDVYAVCADDGRIGFPTADSEYESLTSIEAGGQVAGTAEIGVPVDCAEVIVQVRVLAITPGGDHIADVTIPSAALP